MASEVKKLALEVSSVQLYKLVQETWFCRFHMVEKNSNPVIFKTISVIFRTNPVIVRTHPVIFRTNAVTFWTTWDRNFD